MKEWKIFKWFNNINIRNKLLISYVMVVFVPVLLVGLILTYNMTQMSLDRAINEAKVNVDRIHVRLNEAMKVVVDVASKTYIDRKLEDILVRQYDSALDVFNAYDEYEEFNDYLTYHREIADIKLYAYNMTILDNGQFVKLTKEVEESPWFQRFMEGNGKFCWQYIYNEEDQRHYLSLASLLKGVTKRRTLGILVISLQESYLSSILVNEPYDTIVVDDRGNIIAASNPDLVGRTLDGTSEKGEAAYIETSAEDKDLSALLKLEAGINQVEYHGQPSKAIVKAFVPSAGNQEFKIISILPIRSIAASAAMASRLGFTIIAASLFMAFILISIFTRAISRRIKRISRDMHRVASGDFDVVPVIEGNDEIGQLSGDLGIMVKSIKELVHEVYEVNLQKKQLIIRQREIKLKMLANQINPHFLFNALETIRMKAHCKGEQEIAGAVKQLGKIMRKSLEAGNEPVPLESEIDLVKSYLEIQKFRYEDKLNYEIHVEGDIEGLTILPLMIQPLVENAVIHGLECKEGPGNVRVSLSRGQDRLYIQIEDDGIGMDPARLRHVQSTLEENDDPPGRRIGLKNVYQRIKLYYGEEYGLKVFSEKGRGTRIELELPIREVISC